MTKTILSLLLLLPISLLRPLILGEPNPISPYKFSFGTKSEDIERELVAKQKFYKDLEWSEVELSVNENNLEVNKNIAQIDVKMQNLYSQLRKLRLAANLKQIEDNLIALKDSRKSIIQTTETQLQAINYQGLYLAIHSNVKPLDKEEVLVNNMRTVISPTAIATANQVFIQNILALKNNQVEYDYIYQKISGSMEPVNSLYTDANKNEGYFLQIRQEKIYPLLKTVKAGNTTAPSTQNIKIIDLYNNKDYTQELAQVLPDADLRSRLQNNWLNTRLSEFNRAIAKYNESSRFAEVNISTETQKQLAEIDKEIALAEKELSIKRAEVQKILQSIGVNDCSLEQLLSCISNAEKKIATSMNLLQQEKIAEKEKELVAQVFDVSGQSSDPSKSIALDTYLKVESLNQSNGTIKSFLQELTIVNGSVNSYGSAASSDVFRAVQHFWMYPMTTNQNQYKVGVVLRFKMGNVLQSQNETQKYTLNYAETVNGVSFVMKAIPGRSYYMGETEVTQALWQAVMGNNASNFQGCPQCPVENVSWNDVQDFLKKLNQLTGKTYRLPTETEWEYAAKGGQNYEYAGSNNIDDVAWYSGNAGKKTHAVKGKKANGYGLYDMSCNVWEWCEDWYDSDKKSKVLRGGSWGNYDNYCRVSFRNNYLPNLSSSLIGFRVVR